MIYVLIPHSGLEGMRVFSNFGLMEQVILRQADLHLQWHLDPDWCSVFGYESEVDELAPTWIWHIGSNGQLIREHVSQLPSIS